MRQLLTARDIKILQALCDIGPRNFSKVAKITGIPRRTLEFRIKRLQSDPRFYLRMQTSVYHTNIGLRKTIVIAKAEPGMEQLLFDCLSLNGYWLYISRSYGTDEGCTAIYAIPIEHCKQFEEFIQEMTHLEVAENARIYWSTCFQAGRITADWFDSNEGNWFFPWNDWIREVQTQTIDLPYTLVEPKSYPIHGDELDINLLMYLDADATTSLSKIAEVLGISRQLAQFRFKKHLVGKRLIEGYEVFVMRYGDTPWVMVLFIISFPNYEKFARFARSLLDKFFVLTMGKVIGKDAILLEAFLPTSEFRKFIDALSTMARLKLVTSYEHIIQDLRMKKRQTISAEYFKGNSWVYDHKDHMERLREEVAKYPSTNLKPDYS